ncbi:RNA methyltransferase [Undibacterium sp. RTI2.1]|uniref:RNA methyltransferase n=1 Tax=unclassified Undibacterium TaxID=2630295 RepID=UPI002AB58BB5|nr:MULTISPECIES: RNA methyltransferase [unclassified Undibacterium]MDY7538185.1 RNA methyltransferase [Undibacterium sp. 5I1]MEB0032396.1 RNA methyltransferase [Undibacterium sp. RTI2.1]MEB0116785.1 RNA methyltransferase [Undibacterium sp. RTI2.2]MEB0229588.1 RNA methyltransferase [Undibacterium sp. 10I3]MEB0257333.1 RNA methyltransferase [Undibacterium sp. 5I1]
MNLLQTNTSLFKRLRFVMVETSHPGNIGAVARAIKTMGFAELVLVNPRFPDALSNPDAIAFASGAQDVLDSAQIVDSIDAALSGCQFVAAVSARLREFSPPICTPREVAQRLTHSAELSGPVALVFGNERFGLPNEIVVKCNALINIPANPDYSSLNLAQAVQLLAYECRIAEIGDKMPTTDIGFQGAMASADDIEGMYVHLEKALIAINFLDPAHPKKLMPRLKRLFSRAQLEAEEVNILRGIAKKILESKVG